VACGGGGRQHESGWAKLPVELLRKMLQAAEQCARRRWGRCKASATVQLPCSGWKCRHDALVMRLLLGQDATDEGAGVLVRRGGGSLDLKCCCFNALTDKGMLALSSLMLHTRGSLELQGDARGDARSARLHWAHVQEAKPVGAEKLSAASPSTCGSYCEVRWAAGGAGSTLSSMPNLYDLRKRMSPHAGWMRGAVLVRRLGSMVMLNLIQRLT
jgi:hypothetical protein